MEGGQWVALSNITWSVVALSNIKCLVGSIKQQNNVVIGSIK